MEPLRKNEKAQRWVGLGIGVFFGFLLQRGGVTQYDTIIAQLRLTDFTVVKVMLSAILVGMVGVYALRSLGLARLHPKAGSVGMTVIGGLIFGVGFAVLGFCPGTIAGAIGQGALDALFGGAVGMVIGAWLFAVLYPRLQGVLQWGDWGEATLPELLHVNAWAVVVPVAAMIVGLLYWIESAGL